MAALARDVVGFIGGLGNQLHQLAFGRWLELRTGRPVRFDISFHRPRKPDVFDLERLAPWLDARLLRSTRIAPTPTERLGRQLRALHGPRRIVCEFTAAGPEQVSVDDAAWWFGCWQREQYAAVLVPDLAAGFGVARAGHLDAVIGIHVRRGDRLGTPWILPVPWFRRAVAELRVVLGPDADALPVRVWSDDPEWCRKELDLGQPFEVAPRGSALEDLAALSRCQGLVLSRSTFSWWAARIATEFGAAAVYPSPWWPDAPELEPAIVPEHWQPLPAGGADDGS